jgi:hypothetical protein
MPEHRIYRTETVLWQDAAAPVSAAHELSVLGRTAAVRFCRHCHEGSRANRTVPSPARAPQFRHRILLDSLPMLVCRSRLPMHSLPAALGLVLAVQGLAPAHAAGQGAERICPSIMQPVCAKGAGGTQTFPNRCLAEGAGFTVVKEGSCDGATGRRLGKAPATRNTCRSAARRTACAGPSATSARPALPATRWLPGMLADKACPSNVPAVRDKDVRELKNLKRVA